MEKQQLNYTVDQINAKLADVDNKSSVSVSNTGTATDTVQYITVNGVEKKLVGGGSGTNKYFHLINLSGTTDDNSTVVDI